MLSVGRIDGRKGLGFGVGGEMEEAELEEGEASCYQDDDAGMDHDVALSSLSYIDERIQHVLGHFQKDFEGGVSAENLGAKFGGYGSFLPTHQRSPSIWSHPRSPHKVQTYSTPKSPNNLLVEGGQNRPSLMSGSHSARHASDPNSARLSSNMPYMDNSSTTCILEDVNTNRSVSATDQKMLKLRIKVGSNTSLSAQKNAAIYSGLGLMSPSSSLEDSPSMSGGLSPEFHAPDEYPLTLLQRLTSFVVPGEQLVSPLHDCLLRINEKKKHHLKDSKTEADQKGSQPIPTKLTGEHIIRDKKGFGEKKTKSVEKKRTMEEINRRTVEEQSANGKNSVNDTSDNLHKEHEIEAPGGREPVSNGAKLPLLSGSKDITDKLERPMNGDGGSYKVFDLSREENKGDVKDQTFSSDLVKEEGFESMTSFDPSKVSKSGNELVLLKEKLNLLSSSTDKMWEEKRTSKDVSFDPRKDGRIKVEKNFNMCTVDSDGFRGRTDLAGGSDDPSEEKAVQKATSYERNLEKTSQGKEGKKKKKGNQSNGNLAVEFPKQSSKSISFVARKDKKSSQAQDSLSGIRSDAIKPFKVSSKTISRECQRDSLGDTKVQQADNRTNSVEMSFKDKMKDSKLDSEKETHLFVEKSEKYVAKKVENPSTSEAYANPSAPLSANGPGTDAVIAPALPVVIEENWVCCDKCQKWRLLPYGTNPNLFLGKKWRCSMLDWLPGMNKCTISEEETTKALNALYQLPVPEGHNSVQGQYNGVASGKASADLRHPDQSHEHSLVMPNIGRKKHGSKDTSNAIDNTILTPPPNSMKRNQQSSVKSRSSTDANKVAFLDTSKSTDLVNEKKWRKQKEQHKVLESYSGDYIHQSRKYPKTKDKRESDCDNGFTTSKKIKKEGSHCKYEDWQSDCDVRKEIPNPSNELLIKVTGKDPKHNGYSSSKDSKGDTRDGSLSSRKKLKGQLQVPSDGEYKAQFLASDMGRPNEMDFAAKKRKLKEWQQSQGYAETLQNNGPVSVKDEISESELRREKKMKSSKSEEKEYNKSKPDGRIEKKVGVTKIVLSASRDLLAYGMEEESGVGYGNHGNAVSQRTRDGVDLSKREPVYPTQTSTAANSSSSKVSGSHQSRGNLPEVKYSPVESVSSSPLRGSNTDKLTTAARRNILIKEDAPNVCFPVVVSSPRRCLDGEVEGRNDQSGSIRKEKASTVQHKSLEMQRDADSLMLHDYQDEDAHQMSSGKAKNKTLSKSVVGMQNNPSPEFENINVVNGGADTADQHNPYLNEEQGKDLDHHSGEPNNHYQINGSGERKLGKGSCSLSRDMHRNARSDIDKDNVKVSDSCIEQEELYPKKSLGVDAGCRDVADFESRDLLPYRENFRDAKCNIQKAQSVKSDKDNKNYPVKKDPTTKLPGEGQRDSHSTSGPQGSPLQIKQHIDLNSRGGKSGAICIKDGKSNLQHNFPQTTSREDVRSSDLLMSDRTDRAEMALGRGKSQSFSPPGDKQESDGKGSRPDVFPVDASVDGAMKVRKQPNGVHHGNVRKPTPNGFVVRDLDCSSQHIKDYGQVAAKVLKEAKDLKHSADRLKRGDGELESTNLFFRAALKFLHGASLLELCSSESAKTGETTLSMKYYTDTAMLCMFCAHEYEKCKEMAAAALAYKCVEVAYMKVIFSKHPCASRDQCKLQKALQTVPSGESPSSSASDVDDLNNQSTLGKVALGKGIDTPQPASNHVIPASNRPNYERMLSYVQYVNSAMEASRKAQHAFAAARVGLKEARYSPEDISSVRDVLDFNFHDVERLIRLVRLAMEAICC